MAVTRVVLFLALASVVAVNAAPSGFLDFIASGSKAKAQSAYEEVETTSTCLQLSHNKACFCLDPLVDGVCYHSWTETKVACCQSLDGDKYSSVVEDLLADKPVVGDCEFTEQYFDTPAKFEGHDGIVKVGTFEAKCTALEDAKDCGEPLCEGMTISVKGKILRYGNVAFIKDLVNIPGGESYGCPLTLPSYDSSKKTPVKLQYSKGDEEEEGPKFMVGEGDIYVGVFHVTSFKHKTPYKTGSFEMIKHTGNGVYTSATYPPEKCYVAKDGAAALDFFKSTGGYY